MADETTVTVDTSTPDAPAPAPRQKPGPKPKPKNEARIGRIVMYTTADETERPAIITRLNEKSLDLTVFNSEGSTAVRGVIEGDEPGEYHWPTY